jgi:hypothetical protein
VADRDDRGDATHSRRKGAERARLCALLHAKSLAQTWVVQAASAGLWLTAMPHALEHCVPQ